MLTKIINKVNEMDVGEVADIQLIDHNKNELFDIEQKALFGCYMSFKIINKIDDTITVKKINNPYFMISRYFYGHNILIDIIEYYYKDFCLINKGNKITFTEFKMYIEDELFMWVV